MQIDRLAAVIRPRTPWEGLDLGFALARGWFLVLFGLWWLTALPIGALGAIWLKDSPSLWMLLIWWFKPLYEAPLLFWLSRRLFGDTLSLRDLWRARRQVMPLRLLPNLLWRRLQPSRSLQMSVLILEGLVGKARRQRQRVLQGPGGTASWLTIICVHLESILWLSALLLIAIMIPEELPGLDLSASLLEEGSAPYWISTLIYWFAMAVMAPFYVAAGFALYLARRTELEAWDLELQFRRVEEAPRQRPRRTATVIVIALALSLVVCLPRPVQALAMTPEQAKAEIQSVLEDEDFSRKREIETWVYIGEENAPDESAELPDWLTDLLRSLGRSGELAATVLKWLLLLAAAVLVIVVLQRILRDLRKPERIAASSKRRTSTAVSFPPRLEIELPADIPAAVDALIDSGDRRGALALLYAASIALLHRRYGLTVKGGATESEYLTLVLNNRPISEGTLMRRLVRAWQRIAYGHLEPAPEELSDLVHDWRHWEGGGHDG